MAANRQTDRHTHARAQCSHASVGLAQASPKYHAFQCLTTLTMASLTNLCIVVGTTLDVEETEHWY